MFAVIKTGGKQYRVTGGDVLVVEKLDGDAGDAVQFDTVLMLARGDGAAPEVGAPGVAGASVAGTIVEQTRGPKVIAFKKRRRKNSRRKRGHRQDLTRVRITDIIAGGASLVAAAASRAPSAAVEAPSDVEASASPA